MIQLSGRSLYRNRFFYSRVTKPKLINDIADSVLSSFFQRDKKKSKLSSLALVQCSVPRAIVSERPEKTRKKCYNKVRYGQHITIVTQQVHTYVHHFRFTKI